MKRPRLLPALAGIAAVAFGLGVAELVAGVFAPRASPVVVVGAALIDLAPPWAKDAAIALFGTADKVALLAGIALVLAGLAALAGVLEFRRPMLGRAIVLGGGLLGLAAAVTRAGASPLDATPEAAATIAAVLALPALLDRIPGRPAAPEPGDVSRRRFLGWAGGAAAAGALAALAGSALRAGVRATTAARDALRLPAPAVALPPAPASASLDVPGISPVITPNAQFYRIDTALQVPDVDPAGWSLRIHGMVEREVVLTWDELLALPLEESRTTLSCVSNPVGGDLIGTATWLGYPIRHLLERAAPLTGADMVLSRSVDGFTASTPLEVLTDDRAAILAVGMNGEPLPFEHGFPVRIVVPGLYGYVSATKWVSELEVTRFADAEAYWTTRGWSERGPIKLQSRIDVPRGRVEPGDTVIAGVAWHPHTGVARVEVSVDEGPWREAELATPLSADTWVQWRLDWRATPGTHVLSVRATSADGEVQTAQLADVVPDGATGHHTVTVVAG